MNITNKTGNLISVVIILSLVMIFPSLLLSQNQDDESKLELDQLRTPASPGFVLLGVEPSSVEQPRTPKALAFSMLTAQWQSSLIPKNYAIEIAPYWLTSHPGLTYKDYYTANLGKNLLRNLSLSLATTTLPSEEEEIPAGSSIGLGIRTLLLAGKANSKLTDLRKDLIEQQLLLQLVDLVKESGGGNIGELRQNVENTFDNIERNPGLLNYPDLNSERIMEAVNAVSKAALAYLEGKDAQNEEEVGKLLEEMKIVDESKSRKIALEMQTQDKSRIGWIAECAGAMTIDFPGNSFEESKITRWGLWATPSFRSERIPVDFVGVARFIRDVSLEVPQDVFDLGGRLVYKYHDLFLSAEFVQRFRSDDSNTTRFAGMLEYRLNQDLYLMANFGKNYEIKDELRGNLIMMIGLNFGLGQKPLLNLQ
ncbi:hypothetical protein ACFLR7_03595 [Acidobacteriota bacterium]